MNIHDILQDLVDHNGSDVHIVTGTFPTLRIDGVLTPVEDAPTLTREMAESLIMPLMNETQQEYLQENWEIDFAYQYKNIARFRVNVYRELDTLAAALRLIPTQIRTVEELGLPPILHEFTKYRQGLVLMTGPTGHGKSTSLAAMIDEINTTRGEHIVTIEDPVEFVYQHKQSIISQRELNHDTKDWTVALRSVLREDPDVVLVGEMRDFDTIAAAITVAETGHLVFATLHTNSASQTIDRIIDVFPSVQQAQIRQQLAVVIKAVVSQRLLPMVSGGRVAATEILMANSAVKNLIRENKTYQIDNVMQTSSEAGMILMESSLYSLVQRGAITPQVAKDYAVRPGELERLLGQ